MTKMLEVVVDGGEDGNDGDGVAIAVEVDNDCHLSFLCVCVHVCTCVLRAEMWELIGYGHW
jgi:hypothetical protein